MSPFWTVVFTLEPGPLSVEYKNHPRFLGSGSPRFGNAVFITVINVEDFIPIDEFKSHVDGLIEYVKSSKKVPGVSEILYPGEFEAKEKKKRLENGVFVEDETWNQIVKAAQGFNIDTTVPDFQPVQ